MSRNKLLIFSLCLLSLLVGFTEERTDYSEKVYGQWVVGNQQFVSTEKGLLKLSKEGLGHYVVESWYDRVMDLDVKDESIMAVTYNGILYAISDSTEEKIAMPTQKNGLPYVLNGIVYKDDHWWISCLEGIVFEFDGKKVVRKFELVDPKTKKAQNINGMGLDNNDQLWVSSLNRVYFLTGIHKRRRNRMGFLASSEFEFETARLFSNTNGVYVLSTDAAGKHSLSLGILNESVMDAIRKDVNLPNEIEAAPVVYACATKDVLHILSGNFLFTLENLQWSKSELQNGLTDIVSFSVINGQLWFGTSTGLKQFPIQATL